MSIALMQLFIPSFGLSVENLRIDMLRVAEHMACHFQLMFANNRLPGECTWHNFHCYC